MLHGIKFHDRYSRHDKNTRASHDINIRLIYCIRRRFIRSLTTIKRKTGAGYRAANQHIHKHIDIWREYHDKKDNADAKNINFERAVLVEHRRPISMPVCISVPEYRSLKQNSSPASVVVFYRFVKVLFGQQDSTEAGAVGISD